VGGPGEPLSAANAFSRRPHLFDGPTIGFRANQVREKDRWRAWSARLGSLDRAFVHGLMKLVHVVANDGEKQRFVIGSRVESAATINAAIQTAKASA
jgi:N-acetylglutamate synthase/N-acetylornithine aminotransferase